jgi:hypothetical protein
VERNSPILVADILDMNNRASPYAHNNMQCLFQMPESRTTLHSGEVITVVAVFFLLLQLLDTLRSCYCRIRERFPCNCEIRTPLITYCKRTYKIVMYCESAIQTCPKKRKQTIGRLNQKLIHIPLCRHCQPRQGLHVLL